MPLLLVKHPARICWSMYRSSLAWEDSDSDSHRNNRTRSCIGGRLQLRRRNYLSDNYIRSSLIRKGEETDRWCKPWDSRRTPKTCPYMYSGHNTLYLLENRGYCLRISTRRDSMRRHHRSHHQSWHQNCRECRQEKEYRWDSNKTLQSVEMVFEDERLKIWDSFTNFTYRRPTNDKPRTKGTPCRNRVAITSKSMQVCREADGQAIERTTMDDRGLYTKQIPGLTWNTIHIAQPLSRNRGPKINNNDRGREALSLLTSSSSTTCSEATYLECSLNGLAIRANARCA